MAGTSTKMSVDVSQFKSGMQQAQAAARTLDAELKRNEAQFKATGNAEQYMADKTRLLQMQLQTQKAAVTQIEGALQKMRDAGVSKTSVEYQKLQTQLSNAQTAMLNTSVELNNLATGEQNAAKGADQLAQSVSGISQKMSLDQVVRGIDKITSTMEKAAKKAVELGQAIWDNIMDSAKWSDDIATDAFRLDMTVEDYQRYKGVFDTIGELTVQDWIKTKQKVQKAIYDASDDQKDFLKLLGISTYGFARGDDGKVEVVAREWEDVFWDVVTETQKRIENGSMTQDAADVFFNNFFGKSFSNLKPLMKLGREGFAEALKEQAVSSEDAINKMAELNDTVVDLQGDFEKLKNEVFSGMAPALKGAAEAVDGLLESLLEYLQKPEGQKMLEDMGTAVSGLFEDLGKIDPKKVVSGFKEVFDKIVSGVQWIVANKDGVIGALKAIVIGWGGLKLTGGALEILKLVNGLNSLRINGMPNLSGTEPAGAQNTTVLPSQATMDSVTNALNGSVGTGVAGKVAGGLTSKVGITTTATLMLYPMIESILSGDARERLEHLQEQENILQQYREVTEGLSPKYSLQTLLGIGSGGGGSSGGHGFGIPVEPVIEEEAAEETWEQMLERLGMQECEIEVEEIEVPDDAAEQVAEQVGTVTLPGQIIVGEGGIIYGNGGGSSGGHGFANGIWSVPWDGFPAILHKGERVVPAREVSSHNYSSNLYVESMYMNNGQDAAGLAAAMAAAQRRTMAGFGS